MVSVFATFLKSRQNNPRPCFVSEGAQFDSLARSQQFDSCTPRHKPLPRRKCSDKLPATCKTFPVHYARLCCHLMQVTKAISQASYNQQSSDLTSTRQRPHQQSKLQAFCNIVSWQQSEASRREREHGDSPLLVTCLLTTLFKLKNVLTLQPNDTRQISRMVGARDLQPEVLALAQWPNQKKERERDFACRPSCIRFSSI